MDTTVKHFSNLMTNSGSFLANLNNTTGTLITLLDACLVNGFGSVTPTSITVSSGVATATFSGAHPFKADTVASISGATPSGLNGEHKVISLSSTGTSITFDAYGVSDGSASGTITMKLAPLGWEKTYSGTNKAVYRQTDVTGTRFYLRVDDSVGNYAKVRGYETMSDVDTGTNEFPRVAQVADVNCVWPKSTTSTAKKWWLAGNSKIFYLGIRGADDAFQERGVNFTLGFGDIQAAKSGDSYKCMISSSYSTDVTQASYLYELFSYPYNSTYNQKYFVRSYTQLGLPVTFNQFGTAVAVGSAYIPGAAPAWTFPNPEDTGIYIFNQGIAEGTTIRGWMPGVYCPIQLMNYTNYYNDVYLNDFVSYSRKMLWKALTNDQTGGIFIDVTGPWGN